MKVTELIRELVNIGEKGANVARIIRSEHALLELLVQEKTGEQKNERFVQDFKTLADVLVQQIVSHDLSLRVIIFIGMLNCSSVDPKIMFFLLVCITCQITCILFKVRYRLLIKMETIPLPLNSKASLIFKKMACYRF